jgi:hypothetical protein
LRKQETGNHQNDLNEPNDLNHLNDPNEPDNLNKEWIP